MLQAIPYHPHLHEGSSQCRCRGSTASPRRSIATLLQTAWSAWRESLAAQRDYERLRSRGHSHDAALRQAFAFGPAEHAHALVDRLHFAGRA
jgi:hypothetical protein